MTDNTVAKVLRSSQLLFQVGHIIVFVTIALCFTQAHAIDDGSMVQAVGDDRVGRVKQRLENTAVGVETCREENRVVLAEVGGNLLFELPMQGLGAADESNRCHAEAIGLQRLMRSLDDPGVIGETEVIVGA